MTKNICVVEDDKLLGNILEKIINYESKLTCLYLCKNASEALSIDSSEKIDLFLLDIRLPDMNGIELLKRLKTIFPIAKFVMFTTFDDSDLILEAFRNGANGYITKNEQPVEIIAAIFKALENESPMSNVVGNKIVEHLQLSQKKNSKLSLLTARELEVLELLAKGMTYKDISDTQFVAVTTIKKHCSNIYQKLDVTNRTEALNIYHNNQ